MEQFTSQRLPSDVSFPQCLAASPAPLPPSHHCSPEEVKLGRSPLPARREEDQGHLSGRRYLPVLRAFVFLSVIIPDMKLETLSAPSDLFIDAPAVPTSEEVFICQRQI